MGVRSSSCSTLGSLFLQNSQLILTASWYFWIQAGLIWVWFLRYVYMETLKLHRPEWLISQVNNQSKINVSQIYDKDKHLPRDKLLLCIWNRTFYMSKWVTGYIFSSIYFGDLNTELLRHVSVTWIRSHLRHRKIIFKDQLCLLFSSHEAHKLFFI